MGDPDPGLYACGIGYRHWNKKKLKTVCLKRFDIKNRWKRRINWIDLMWLEDVFEVVWNLFKWITCFESKNNFMTITQI